MFTKETFTAIEQNAVPLYTPKLDEMAWCNVHSQTYVIAWGCPRCKAR